LKAPTSTIVTEYDSVISHEEWAAILEPALCQNAAAAELVARLLFTIKKAIEAGPDGAARAARSLSVGIEVAYLHTDAHKAAQRLYLLSLTGELKPQDEPLRLIDGAISRGTIETGLKKKRRASN
jgi:hypothetical protein